MFDAWFKGHAHEAASWLRELHAHPELGFEEHRTAAFVAHQLRKSGLEVIEGIGGTGVVGVLRAGEKSKSNRRVIGFRAELDALPIHERAEIDYRSKVDGKSHACGHDGHAVTLMTAAAYLAGHGELVGDVVFIFQPAEELLTGARAMLEDGLLERFPCDEIYALHNIPGLPCGHVGVVRGGALASCDEVVVTIHATGTHGAAPHTGTDAVMAAGAFLTSLQQSLTRVIDSRDSCVISFGRISGGTAGNVLPDRVSIWGTMRSHSKEARSKAASQIDRAALATEQLLGVGVEVSVEGKVPVTINHPVGIDAVSASATRVVGPARIVADPRPVMASEDFSLFLERVPGAFFFVGQGGPFCHDPAYIFDPAVIPVGAHMICDLAVSRTAAGVGGSDSRNAKSQPAMPAKKARKRP